MNYRAKVLGYTLDQLTKMGFSVNAFDCKPGEFWVISSGRSQLARDLHRHGIKPLSDIEIIRTTL